MTPRSVPTPRRPTKVGLLGCLVLLPAVIAMSALGGWALMLLIGALHGEFGVLRPIGFSSAWGLSVLIGLVRATFSTNRG